MDVFAKIPLQEVRVVLCIDKTNIRKSFQIVFQSVILTIVPKEIDTLTAWYDDLHRQCTEIKKMMVQNKELKEVQPDGNSNSKENKKDKKKKKKPDDKLPRLKEILQNKDLGVFFREFLYQQFCQENLSFWLEVEELKVATMDPLVVPKAREIYDKYFSPRSDAEINVSFSLRRDLDKFMANSSPTRATFDKAQHAIYELLTNDSVPRFFESQLWADYKGGKKIKKSLPRGDTTMMLSGYIQRKQKK